MTASKTSATKLQSEAIAAPPKPPTPPTKPPAPQPNSDFDLADAITKVAKKNEAKSKPDVVEPIVQEAIEQADRAAEDSKPKVRPPSKTHGVLPKHSYSGPRDEATYVPSKAGRAISRRDILPKRYLVLIARPEGADENTCRRVNTDRGPTVGGFAQYTANSTGVNLIYKDGAYRVGENVGGNIEVARDEFRQEVFDLCGGQEYLDFVVSVLGPDFTIGLPPKTSKTKEVVAA